MDVRVEGSGLTREEHAELCKPSCESEASAASSSDLIVQDSPPTAICKAGTHPDVAENRDDTGRCKLCQREWHRQHYLKTRQLKRSPPPPRWDGTLKHLFALGWIQVRNEHWIWCHTVNKRTGRPKLGNCGIGPARQIWELSGHGPIPDGHLLSHNRSLCSEQLCVHPACWHVVKRGAQMPPEARARGLLIARARVAAVTIDDKIAKRVVRDDTGCLRWVGRFEEKHGEPKWAVLDFHKKRINVRRYL